MTELGDKKIKYVLLDPDQGSIDIYFTYLDKNLFNLLNKKLMDINLDELQILNKPEIEDEIKYNYYLDVCTDKFNDVLYFIEDVLVKEGYIIKYWYCK
jgi:hypothetical protein